MKITINADSRHSETEIVINCNHMSDDIEKILASLRLLDLKLTARKGSRQYIIEAVDIMYIESIDKRTFIYTLTDVFESSLRLYELEARLANKNFLRASKNCIFNLSHIQFIEPELDNKLILTVKKGIKLIASRQYSGEIKKILEAYNV